MTISENVRKHIRVRHPELSRYENAIQDIVASPEFVLKGYAGRFKAVKHLDATHLGTQVSCSGLPRRKGREGYYNGLLHVRAEEDKGRDRMESLRLRPEKIDIDYDEESDVLYISVGKPKEADDSIEPQEGVVMRTRGGELVGITILGLKNRILSAPK